MFRSLSTTLTPTETRQTATSIAANTTGSQDLVSDHCLSLDDGGLFVKASAHLLDTNSAYRYLHVSDDALRSYRLLSLSHLLRHDSLCVVRALP
jgi:hypothetical protein